MLLTRWRLVPSILRLRSMGNAYYSTIKSSSNWLNCIICYPSYNIMLAYDYGCIRFEYLLSCKSIIVYVCLTLFSCRRRWHSSHHPVLSWRHHRGNLGREHCRRGLLARTQGSGQLGIHHGYLHQRTRRPLLVRHHHCQLHVYRWFRKLSDLRIWCQCCQ